MTNLNLENNIRSVELAVIVMARTTRAAAAASKPVTVKKAGEKTSKSSRKAKESQRRNLYKKAKRARQIQAIKTALQGADDPATKKELSRLRGHIFKPRRKDSVEVQQLKVLLTKQQEEIEALRKALQGTNVPRLEPPASPTVEATGEEEPDSSPVKIQQQLLMEVAQSSNVGGSEPEPEVPSASVEVEEEVAEETTGDDQQPEGMEGVEATIVTDTTVTTTITTDKDIVYPTLPTVEGDDVANEVQETIEQASSPERPQASVVGQSSEVKEEEEEAVLEAAAGSGQVTPKLSGTPLKPTAEFRDSSADSTTGTPRNVRRSPRKRTKRRSFAGHSYAV